MPVLQVLLALAQADEEALLECQGKLVHAFLHS